MGLSINTNLAALNAYRNLGTTQGDLSKSLEKLSSGLRINRAADDAAGLAISEGLRAQISGTKQAVRNAQDGISVVQTAEGALTETHSILQRMRTLSVQAANDGGLSDKAKLNIQDEMDQLTDEIDRIAATTQFNGTPLLDGEYNKGFQVGANTADSDRIEVSITKMDAETLTVGNLAVANREASDGEDALVANAKGAIQAIDIAIGMVSDERSKLGAIQNRFDHTINNLNVAVENLSASESRIRDTDMAQEMVSFTRAQILSQAGTAMLAQAKNLPQSVLQLLQ
ncbi:flagellin [Cellulomonas sp. zg-ZUI22]|uniref:flagellin N-terminal helical domain-containing protein n=1 Tax=Cellulomonas sp. zg-ZUI22 TaxID=2816955 RepID=UPI001A93E0A5|nr:flagellin [Cellulomonas sp. zg-ZUI22]MBO0901283.1 flagellin [Cellulomonas sp. zg-ZUI22]